eukprot:scaffold836_cov123-Isochrysis_galbana.AAC.3
MASPADARGLALAPPHAGPLGRHTLMLTTASSPQHPDCFRCLAAPPRERAKPGGPSLASSRCADKELLSEKTIRGRSGTYAGRLRRQLRSHWFRALLALRALSYCHRNVCTLYSPPSPARMFRQVPGLAVPGAEV